MTANQLKRILKRVLPAPLLNAIQRIRKLGHTKAQDVVHQEARFRLWQNGAPDEITLRPGLNLRIHSESRTPFEWFCFRSPSMVREFDLFCSEAATCDSFVDVGANHGIFSLVFAMIRPKGHVLAIEPSPVAFDILTANRSMNGLTQIAIRNLACGELRSQIRMKRNWHHLEAVPEDNADGDIVMVQTVPIDDLCAEQNLWPELLKIDVEGFELPVLRGATRALERARVLFIEIHPDLLVTLHFPQTDIFDMLSQRGWTLTGLRGDLIGRAEFADRIHTFWVTARKDGKNVVGIDRPAATN